MVKIQESTKKGPVRKARIRFVDHGSICKYGLPGYVCYQLKCDF